MFNPTSSGSRGLRIVPTACTLAIWLIALPCSGQMPGWRRMPDLPLPLFNASASASSSHVFVAGGSSGGLDASNIQDNVYSAPINADGTLGAFQVAGKIPFGPRAGMGLGFSHGNLYMFGGYSSENYKVQPDSAVLPILPTGKLGTLRPAATKLPMLNDLAIGDGFGRSDLAYQNILFLVGGEAATPNPNLKNLYTNLLTVEGSMAPNWVKSRHENPVTNGVWNNATALISGGGGRVLAFCIGGQTHPNSGNFSPSSATNQVSVAAINPQSGDTDAWVLTDPLPVRKHSAAAVALSNRIYVIGGTADGDSMDDSLYIGNVETATGRIRWAYQPGSFPIKLAVPCATKYQVGKRNFLAVFGGSSTGDPQVWILELPSI
jgi:hypothetical protein